jgi:hypothetical protein
MWNDGSETWAREFTDDVRIEVVERRIYKPLIGCKQPHETKAHSLVEGITIFRKKYTE